MDTDIELIRITDKAQEQLKVIAISQEQASSEETNGVRLKVVGGGCSGLSYKMDFDQAKDSDYQIKLSDECLVLVDPKSAIYLKDVILDFKDGLQGKGFVFNNPNATNTCGCGESFSV
ncbi:iron-sulfur cluster assembly accessory protein [Bacteriovoracaceae bacterium]|nr:iron-sulfur cluster assembly accessory protein [Bacteriovoracaceae bacterium]